MTTSEWRMPNGGIDHAPQGWNNVGGQEFPDAKGLSKPAANPGTVTISARRRCGER